MEWVAIPFSKGSSRLRDRTHISCTAMEILYHLSHQGSPNNEGHLIENIIRSFSKAVSSIISNISQQHNPKAPLSPRNIQQWGPQQDTGLNTCLFASRLNTNRDHRLLRTKKRLVFHTVLHQYHAFSSALGQCTQFWVRGKFRTSTGPVMCIKSCDLTVTSTSGWTDTYQSCVYEKH